MNTPMIDYSLIADAVSFYQKRHWENVPAPWFVDINSIQSTLPPESQSFNTSWGELVGSAEQSFVQLSIEKKLKPGKYQATTPCFRDDPEDLYHFRIFMKTELFQNVNVNSSSLENVIEDAFSFFSRYLLVKVVKTNTDTFDIVSNTTNLELGSYGIRHNDDLELSWIYGTGCAEPRLSQAMQNKNK